MINGYRISIDQSDMDVESIHKFISQSYWASGIPIETLKKAIDNSLCFGVFNDEGAQAEKIKLGFSYQFRKHA